MKTMTLISRSLNKEISKVQSSKMLVQQLKEQQLQFKEQLLQHIQNKDYDCNFISPTPYPMDQTINEKNQNALNLLLLNKSQDLVSDRSQPSSINCLPTKTSKTNLKGNYMFKQSYLPKSPQTKVLNGTTTKSNRNKNSSNLNNNKSPSNVSTCEQQSARTPEQPKHNVAILSPSSYNSWLKKEFESKSKQYNLSSFIHKSTQKEKKVGINQIMKTEENVKNNKLKVKKSENKVPAQKPRNGFDQWYDSQKQWLRQTEEKIFKQKMQMEQELSEQEQFSYVPEIHDGSRYIVQKKYNNASLLERQKLYQDEVQQKQFQKKLREEEDKKINQVRISPLSRKLLRSASPKSDCSFTICNSSNQNYSTIIKK
ncbi:unnamed protein product (macronuclear) [Paramecium tetraurelia]|uniref:Uncharacterized protein n=1 Tax=Paramecium tetraurelia TaxID=5888 RepID=A0EC03_PARTE|nr:uncharacterized protein GSPATT00025556001 [Paramecium tetraurelia]CAK92820.1 unnamed protein product [Paramecium tetraurelia]|eukprot:XP_001460217.1 hypothetical protein (macronuclear) [Paramecium tetraurelia strain d4-2]